MQAVDVQHWITNNADLFGKKKSIRFSASFTPCKQPGVLSTSSSFCMYSGSFRSRPAFSSSLELGSMNLCRNLCKWRNPKCATVKKTRLFMTWKICEWLTRTILYLELLLAGANIDIRAPDHQPLTGVCVTGNRTIGTRLQEFTRNVNCWSENQFLSN